MIMNYIQCYPFELFKVQFKDDLLKILIEKQLVNPSEYFARSAKTLTFLNIDRGFEMEFKQNACRKDLFKDP